MRRLHAIRTWVLLGLTVVALGTLLTGCMSATLQEQSDRELLPWNEPAAWERTTLGVPF